MEILLASSVLAALITSLVNLRLAFISSKNAKDLEAFKQELGLEVSKQLELTKAKLRSDEVAFTKIWELRGYMKANNITTLARNAGDIDDDSFTKLCMEDVPNLFMEYERRINECSVYLKDERLNSIKESANLVRISMQALINADEGEKKEPANKMLLQFAEYNELVERQLDEASAQGLDELKR